MLGRLDALRYSFLYVFPCLTGYMFFLIRFLLTFPMLDRLDVLLCSFLVVCPCLTGYLILFVLTFTMLYRFYA